MLRDYKTAVLGHGFMGRHRGEMDRAAFEAALDDLGKQGCELAWVFMDQPLQHEKDGHVLVFKRLIDEPAVAASAPVAVEAAPPG